MREAIAIELMQHSIDNNDIEDGVHVIPRLNSEEMQNMNRRPLYQMTDKRTQLTHIREI